MINKSAKSLICSTILAVSIISTSGVFAASEEVKTTETTTPATRSAHDLVVRILPEHVHDFVFEELKSNKDIFEIEPGNHHVTIRGNNANSMAVGLNYYLKYNCHTFVSWSKGDRINAPAQLPFQFEKIRKEARVKNRFFLNYCTYGYTMPWWTWKDWERLIDWMSLNGINMPLAITGQEAVWYKVWKKLGLTDDQIQSYFTGPAYLPWHRMANIDGWHGPLPMSWINGQASLQKKILAREREMNMTPVLPAFAGHVPLALKDKYPQIKITSLGSWGGFNSKFSSYFLDPFDPLFKEIQHAYIEEQTKEFGTDHIYGADPFNEVTPPSWEPKYLADVSRNIFESMVEADPRASWFQMSWLFYVDRKNWTDERIKAYLEAVPTGKLTMLDYVCEEQEVWKFTNSFYQQPYLWCYLGNFGGNTMLTGNLKEVEKRMENAMNNGGANLTGIGSTLEGFDVNAVMYDYVFEKAWSDGPVSVNKWADHWAAMRGSAINPQVRTAWQQLADSVYISNAGSLGTLTNAFPCLTGSGNWTTKSVIKYKNAELLNIWQKLLDKNAAGNDFYAYDITNIGRQVLGNYFTVIRDQFNKSYEQKDIKGLKQHEQEMMTLFDELDALLATQSSFLFGKWVNDAMQLGATLPEKKYYERDARTIVTVWGGETHDLNDYASKSWSGLMKGYYKQRWKIFCKDVIGAVAHNQAFEPKLNIEKIHAFENEWVKKEEKYQTKPVGDGYTISKRLINKYAAKIK
ncbi:alpha-N-acetylglucosaminidase [Pedobacter sp. L105]|uniref:alpha-N-acetylglucosaminidase n=1 Tax=Pedobacter sp. L105 TaxID=1641871 RepID=UPI00131EA1E9|nr:alpha-N-acetylglucosaminidase [Pedobacter sp. L105]